MNQNSNEEIDLIEKRLQETLSRTLEGYGEPETEGKPEIDQEMEINVIPTSRSHSAAAPQSQPGVSAAHQKHTGSSPVSQRPVKASSTRPQKSQQKKPAAASHKKASKKAAASHGKVSKKAAASSKAPQKKKKSFPKPLAILLVICLLIIGLWYGAVSICYGQMNYKEIESLTASPMKEDGVINLLLIGNDSRSNDTDGRSDAMILLSISRKTKTISIMSLLRDMYVEIPEHSGNRLNAAYSYGGPELLMETLEKNLGIEVNRCIQVNFEAFANLTDAVGGVDLELTNGEVQYVNGYLAEYNVLTGRAEGTDYLDSTLSGQIHLNGPQALAYCRNRYIGTDFGRTERQRKVLTEILHKLPLSLLTNPAGIVTGLFPNLTTNLTKGEFLELSLHIFHLASYDMVQSSIPIDGSYSGASVSEMAVLKVDFAANIQYIRQLLYGE